MSGPGAVVGQVLARAGAVAQTRGADGLDGEGGLTTEARVFVALMGISSVVFILVLLRRRQLRGKYALVWTGLAAALGVLGLFPGLLTWISDTVGILYPPALFLLVAVGFLFAVVIQFSWELSRLEDRTRVLAEEMALLHAELDSVRAEAGPAGSDGEDVSEPSGT